MCRDRYFSPFPKEFLPGGHIDRLYLCEHSLRFFAHKSELRRFQARGIDPHPPGNEIYRKDGLAMFEVDGAEAKEYCQNLCYLAKLFLDHKVGGGPRKGAQPCSYYPQDKTQPSGLLACIIPI